MIIVDIQQTQRLNKVYSNASLLSDDHLTDLNNEKTRYVYEQFFEHMPKPIQKLNVLNISSGLASVVVDAYVSSIGTPEAGVEVDMLETVESMMNGYFVWVVSIQDSIPSVEVVDAERFYKEEGNDVVLTYYQKSEAGGIVKYVLKESYNRDELTVTRQLFKRPSYSKMGLEGSEVDLDTIYETREMQPEESLPFHPIVFRKYGNKEYGRSELGRIATKVYGYDIQTVNLQDQLNKHTQAKLVVPRETAKSMQAAGYSSLSEYPIKKMEVMVVGDGESNPSYLTNDNPHIRYTLDFLENMKKLVSAESKVPLSFFGEDVGSNQSGQAKLRDLTLFYAKVDTFRSIITSAYEQLYELLGSLVPIEDQVVIFPQLDVKGDMERLEEAQIAKDAGLMSHQKAIALYQDIDEEQAEEEYKLISEQQAEVDINFN